MKTVTTQLAVGGVKNFSFGENGEHSIPMHDNKPFAKGYATSDEFINDFEPNTPSQNLINKIKEVFNNSGKVTYKPIGYKANMTFAFN